MPNTPFIPELITVHLGPPDSDAENVTLPFSDYIANVASSELDHRCWYTNKAIEKPSEDYSPLGIFNPYKAYHKITTGKYLLLLESLCRRKIMLLFQPTIL